MGAGALPQVGAGMEWGGSCPTVLTSTSSLAPPQDFQGPCGSDWELTDPYRADRVNMDGPQGEEETAQHATLGMHATNQLAV